MATLPLKERYKQEISPSLMKKFDYTSPMQVPKVEKVVINMGVGEAVQNAKVLDGAVEDLAQISGQKACGDPSEKVYRRFQSAGRDADRSQSDSSRRADV